MSAATPVALAANFTFDRKMTGADPKEEWLKFNNSFSNVNVSSAHELSAIVHGGHSICSQHQHISREYADAKGVTHHTSYRHHLNWLPTSICVLDFDQGDWSTDAIQVDPFVEEHSYLIYTTTSHTAEHPRFRLIFSTPAPVQDVNNYRSLLAALAWKYSTADRASANPVQPFAGNKGANFIDAANDHIMRWPVARGLIADYKAWQESEEEIRRQRALNRHYEEPDAEEVAEMLRHIPAHMDYLEWFKVIAAVKNTLGCDTAAEDLLEHWSPGHPGEIAYKLRTIQDGRIGVGYLAKIARSNGYRSPEERQRDELKFIKTALAGRPRWH